jgi:hypothetical protein
MKRHFGSPWSIVLLLGRNLLAFVIFWILSFGFVQFGERVLGGWPASAVGQLLGCVVGVAIALRTRARVTAYFLAAMAAYSASELTIHSVYGIRAAQGAATHFAVMGAGVVGVALGALLTRRNDRGPASYPAAVPHGSLAKPASSTTDTDSATSQQRSNMLLQPTSVATRRSSLETVVNATRG